MAWKYTLSDLDYDAGEIDTVKGVLASKWLSSGPVGGEFEAAFSHYLGIKRAIAVSSGTAGLHLALKALGIGADDEVIVPALSFVATANAVLYVGAVPVFADIISPHDLTISPFDIETKITPRTKAIIVMHYGGHAADMDPIMDIAKENSLFVIEDAAHALGTTYKGTMAGTMGDIGCFSFFATKNLVTGEGGMVATDRDELAEKIRSMRSHAMTTTTWDKHNGHSFAYDVLDLGYNYRMGEVNAALGLVQLQKLDKNNAKRRHLLKHYIQELSSIDEITVPFGHNTEASSGHIFPILLDDQVPRHQFMSGLKAHGIQSSIHYPPIHLFSYYRNRFGYREGMLPLTEYAAQREVTLPLHPLLEISDIKKISATISAVLS